MSKSFRRKTNLLVLQQTPIAGDCFKYDILPGRCRKEFSPGYKEHVSQNEVVRGKSPVLNGPVILHVEHFSIPDTGRQLNKMLFGIIENISRFLTQYIMWQTVAYADKTEENYTVGGKPIRNDNN